MESYPLVQILTFQNRSTNLYSFNGAEKTKLRTYVYIHIIIEKILENVASNENAKYDDVYTVSKNISQEI